MRIAAGNSDTGRLMLRRRSASPVRLDCEGKVRPGLATSWSADSTGRIWTLTLDSTADSAPQLAAAWRGPIALAALRWAGVEAVQPLDAHRVAVVMRDSQSTFPTVFADPALGLDHSSAVPVFETLTDAGDARDALDRGADLLETADPTVVEYASAKPELLVVPLPWSRSYVLLLPPGGTGFEALIPGDTAAFRAALARDAVPGDARQATAPFWWEPRPACGGASASATKASRPIDPAIIYPAGDRVARALAERLVALSDARGASARGLDSASLVRAMASGQGAAFVLPLPRIGLVPCREIASWPTGAAVVPLVETRSRLIVRRGLPPLDLDWDGAVRMESAP